MTIRSDLSLLTWVDFNDVYSRQYPLALLSNEHHSGLLTALIKSTTLDMITFAVV